MIYSITLKSNDKTTDDNVDLGKINLSEPSVVTLRVGPEEVAHFNRSGNNLILTFRDGSTLTIENFFVVGDDDGRNDLVFEDENNVFWWAQYTTPWHGFDIAEIDSDILPPVIWGPLGALLAGGLAAGLAAGGESNHAPPAQDDAV